MMTPFLASKPFGSIRSNSTTSFCPSLNVQGHSLAACSTVWTLRGHHTWTVGAFPSPNRLRLILRPATPLSSRHGFGSDWWRGAGTTSPSSRIQFRDSMRPVAQSKLGLISVVQTLEHRNAEGNAPSRLRNTTGSSRLRQTRLDENSLFRRL